MDIILYLQAKAAMELLQGSALVQEPLEQPVLNLIRGLNLVKKK